MLWLIIVVVLSFALLAQPVTEFIKAKRMDKWLEEEKWGKKRYGFSNDVRGAVIVTVRGKKERHKHDHS